MIQLMAPRCFATPSVPEGYEYVAHNFSSWCEIFIFRSSARRYYFSCQINSMEHEFNVYYEQDPSETDCDVVASLANQAKLIALRQAKQDLLDYTGRIN